MKSILTISRYVVGILFIFSGLIKANDPLGLAYKMQEFFEVWGASGWLPGFMHWLSQFALSFSVIMIALEIVIGVSVLTAWKMHFFGWILLALTIFFTFLTGYAHLSGKFRSCGCFGDCIPLTPKTSFIKDLILLFFVLIIFFFRKKIKSNLSSLGNVSILFLSVCFSFGMQWYVLKHLPLVDCLPFKKGNNLPEQMVIPPGAIPDSTVITFMYKKDGATVEFTADDFPEDFDDSLYHFVKRYDKLIRKGNAEPAIHDFVLTTPSGNDTTLQVLQTPGYFGFLFIKDDPGQGQWATQVSTIFSTFQQQNIPMFIITNNADGITPYFETIPNAFFLKCDGVPIKTAARANPTLYLLQGGTVQNKWGYADWDKALKQIEQLPMEESR